MNFLLGILEGGGSVDEHPLIQQLLDLFWLLMEVQKPHTHTFTLTQYTYTYTTNHTVCVRAGLRGERVFEAADDVTAAGLPLLSHHP